MILKNISPAVNDSGQNGIHCCLLAHNTYKKTTNTICKNKIVPHFIFFMDLNLVCSAGCVGQKMTVKKAHPFLAVLMTMQMHWCNVAFITN